MGDTRIRYGLAYGRMNNWVSGIAGQKGYLGGTDGLFAQANTAPDVTVGVLFYSANSAATTIADFKLSTPFGATGNQAGLFEGKVIKVFFTDSVTTINGSRIFLANSNNTFYSNDWLGLIYHNSAWYETERVNKNIGGSALNRRSISVGGTHTSITADNNDLMLVIVPTATGTIIDAISGGYVGQRLLLVMGTATSTFALGDATSSGLGNIYFVASNQLAFDTTNSSVEVVKVSNTAWSIPSVISA